jgi:NAD(P)-dependent dehydrogenase (short-subunit alcohol dehydrogenase family)
MPNVPVAAIVGIGPGNGGSLTRKFAEEGYQVAMLSRSKESFEQYEREIDRARGFVCDATDAQSVEKAFAEVRQDLGDVDVLIYNAGAGTWGDLEEVSADAFEACWRVNALGFFHCAKAVVGPMVEKNDGAIAVIGASGPCG